jgi:hypothetical protein
MSNRVDQAFEFYKALASALDEMYEVDVVPDKGSASLTSLIRRAERYFVLLQENAFPQEKAVIEKDYNFFLSMLEDYDNDVSMESLRSHYKDPESLGIYRGVGIYGLLKRVQKQMD